MATVKQLRLALDTLSGYHQIQSIGADGQAALQLIENHVTELEGARLLHDPRPCFGSIPPGSRFQILLSDGTSPDRDIYLKLKAGRRLLLSATIDMYAVNLMSGELMRISPETLVKVVEDTKDA